MKAWFGFGVGVPAALSPITLQSLTHANILKPPCTVQRVHNIFAVNNFESQIHKFLQCVSSDKPTKPEEEKLRKALEAWTVMNYVTLNWAQKWDNIVSVDV